MTRRWTKRLVLASSGALFGVAVGVLVSARARVIDSARDGLLTSLDAARALVHSHIVAGFLSLTSALLLALCWLAMRRRATPDSGTTLGLAASLALLGVAAIAYGGVLDTELDVLPHVGDYVLLRELTAHLEGAHHTLSVARLSILLVAAIGGGVAAWRVGRSSASASELGVAAAVLLAGVIAFAATRSHRADFLDPPRLVPMPEPARQSPPSGLPLVERCVPLVALRGHSWSGPTTREDRVLAARSTSCDFVSVGESVHLERVETSLDELPARMRSLEQNRSILAAPTDCLVVEATGELGALREALAIAVRRYRRFYLLAERRRSIPTNTLGDWAVTEGCGVPFEVATDRGVELREVRTLRELASRAQEGRLVLRVPRHPAGA